tara:strand:+ start:1665 stop:1781 length:117 start_codon:yes stop_codon:yes gene_type:complete
VPFSFEIHDPTYAEALLSTNASKAPLSAKPTPIPAVVL